MSVSRYLFIFIFIFWVEFYRHAQFHITTPQRVIRSMHYGPTLRNVPATRTLAEGIHQGISYDPHNPDTLAQH